MSEQWQKPIGIESAIFPADQAPEPVAWRWHDPSDGWRGQWYAMSVKGRFASDEEPPWEMEYAYLAPPNLAAELAEARNKERRAIRESIEALQELAEVRRERDEAIAALDANWVQHQRIVQAEARAEKAEAEIVTLRNAAVTATERAEKAEAALAEKRERVIDEVLKGLRSEDDTQQLRAIIASVEAIRGAKE